MTEIEAKRKELENYQRVSLDRYTDGALYGFNLGVEMARKEFLDLINKLPCKGETHGFRPKWISVEELKQSLGEKT